MATIRLVPSTYTRSSTSRVTVSNDTNMYYNTDHTANYCSIRGRNSSSNGPYYAFIRGFNFGDVPSSANVTAFSIKIRCYKNQYLATGSSYRLRLASSPSNNSVISDTTLSDDITITSTVYTFPTSNLSWSTIAGYGNNFSIEVPLMSTSNQYPYLYVYGAEIEVTYSLSDPRTVTSTLTGSGTISPSGAQTYYDGDTYELHITPTNSADTVTVKNNGTDVTSVLVGPETYSDSSDRTLGSYTLVSGSFNGSGSTYFSGLVGKGYNNTTTTTNYYSGGSSTIAVFTYDMAVTVPEEAIITSCYVMVNGHAESTSQSSEYMCVQLLAGSTAITSELNFKSIGTSNSTQTLQATILPTAAQCATLKLQCRLGYYGGAINGATLYLEYIVNRDYYTYTYTVNGNATIAVTIGSASQPIIYYKVNGSWVAATAVYKKVNGSWVLQNDLTSVFDSNTNYIKG